MFYLSADFFDLQNSKKTDFSLKVTSIPFNPYTASVPCLFDHYLLRYIVL